MPGIFVPDSPRARLWCTSALCPGAKNAHAASFGLDVPRTLAYPAAMTAPDDIASLQAEFAKLRKDTDRLRKELNDLHRFINVEYADDKTTPTNINIRCCILTIAHPDVPNRSQMVICAGGEDSGPFISFWGSDEKVRMVLKVEKDQPHITLFGSDLKEAVLLQTDAADGRGCIGVFDKGKPRAIMKAVPDGSGGIAVLHDDNKGRAILRSTAKHGEMIFGTPDLKTAIKLTSDSGCGGGTLIVHGPTGKPAVILGTLAGFGGSVILNDPEGIRYAALPDPAKLDADGAWEE